MSITTKLTDKLEREIREFCRMNNLQLGEYIAKCIEKQFNLDRYGDLNEKFLPIVIPKKDEPVIRTSPSMEEITIVKGEPEIGTIVVADDKNHSLMKMPTFDAIERQIEQNENNVQNTVKKKRVRTVESK